MLIGKCCYIPTIYLIEEMKKELHMIDKFTRKNVGKLK